MGIRQTVQQLLDATLSKYGIMSHHLRYVKAKQMQDADGNTIAINNDEYVAFRIYSSSPKTFGDGKPLTVQRYVDVNYYYSYDENDARIADAEARIDEIIDAFVDTDRFLLVNSDSDIYDTDTGFRGINTEFSIEGMASNASQRRRNRSQS